jgi:hypothetical protein
MTKTTCRLKGFSSAPKDRRKPFYIANKDIMIAALVVVFVLLAGVFLIHIYRKAPNTNIWGFPIRANRPEMGVRG